MGSCFYARPGQPLREHLRNVGEAASGFARRIGLNEDMARWAGLLHDLGKYSEIFQAKLAAPHSREVVEHSGHGAALAAKHGALEVAFAVAGHHAGLRNRNTLAGLLKRDERHASGARNLFCQAKKLFTDKAALEIEEFGADLPASIRTSDLNDPLRVDLRTRMLFSCLIDADRLDAGRAEDPDLSGLRRSSFPSFSPSEFLAALLSHVRTLNGDDSAVHRVRRSVLDDCLKQAELPPGLFSLTVPTGGGKTLASLAFALRHAASHRLDRIIVVIPYLSIIEQTAEVFRTALGKGVVLEHHSGIQEEQEDDESPSPSVVARRLATENWDAPVIVTTSVQFFESLFSNKPGACRKLHRVPRSVVVMDEVQTFPKELLAPILSAVGGLSRDYGTSFIFCTATQPAFERTAQAGFEDDGNDQRLRPGDIREIVSDRGAHFKALRRVRVDWRAASGTTPWESVVSLMTGRRRALCVLNTKNQALSLFRKLRSASSDPVFHLSTRMCPQHRLDVLKRIRALSGKPCLVVSTQLVEAGVDLDFPLVVRALGPLDSIAQAAGRCNREGKEPEGDVVVFQPEDGGLPGDRGYRAAVQVTESLLREAGGALDIQDPELYRRYFNTLYALGEGDSGQVQALRRALDFSGVAEAFRMVEPTFPVLVPYDETARNLIGKVRMIGKITRDAARSLQRYTIGLYERERNSALRFSIGPVGESGAFECLEGRYNAETGIELGSTDPATLIQ